MVRSIRGRALLFAILFIFPTVFLTRTLQIRHFHSLVESSFDEQLSTRLTILDGLWLGESPKFPPASIPQPQREYSDLFNIQLPPNFTQCKLMGLDFQVLWGIEGTDGSFRTSRQMEAQMSTLGVVYAKQGWIGPDGNIAYQVKQLALPSGESLIVAGDMTALNQSLSYYIRINIFLGILVSLVITIIFWIFFGQIIKPLTKIAAMAEKIRMGTLSSRIKIPRSDNEVSQVGLALNAMMDRLEDTIQAHARFNSNVSHELLSPLNQISYILNETIDTARFDGPTLSKIEECKSAVKRASTLAQDLLQLAHSEITSTTNHVHFDLEPVVDEAIVSANALASEKSLTVDLHSMTLGIMGNPVQVQQVVFNLLSNAIKFAPISSTVHVEMKKGKDYAVVSVSDAGPGILPEEEDRLFQRFFRTRAALSQGITGNGLGLSICKNIMDHHQGTIVYQRTAENRTLFEATFPLKSL